MDRNSASEDILFLILPYIISGVFYILSATGIIFDYSFDHINRFGISILLIIAIVVIIAVFFKTRKNFYKPVKLPAVILLTTFFSILVQLSSGVLWNLYFPLFILLALRMERIQAYIVIILISTCEISSSLFAQHNSFSIRIFQLILLYITIEIIQRVFSFRSHLIKGKKRTEQVEFSGLDKISEVEKIAGRTRGNVIDLIFRNPNVRTVVVLYLENTVEGLRLKIADFRSSAVDSIALNMSLKPGGIIPGLVVKERKYFLVENFTRPSGNLGYYKENIDVGSFCGVPIYFNDEVIGAICEDSSEEGAFNEERAFDLMVYSQILTDVLQISSYLEKKELSATALELINDLSNKFIHSLYLKEVLDVFVRKMKETFSYDDYFIALCADSNSIKIIRSSYNLIKPFEPGELVNLKDNMIMRLIIERNIPLMEKNFHRQNDIPRFLIEPNDGSINVASFIGIPVPSKDQVAGSVFILSTYLNNFNKRDQEILEVYGRLLGAAIERSRLYEEKEKLAIKDGLTGLFNHRYLQEVLEEEISRSQRTSKPMSFCLIDIDYFKKVNDTYGHRTGDKVLRIISLFVKKSVRNFDIVARYGGEELAIILPSCSNKQAVIIAEKVRKGIENLGIPIDEESFLNITVSIGVSSYPLRALNKMNLIEDADKSLYAAKGAGRNRVSYSGKLVKVNTEEI